MTNSCPACQTFVHAAGTIEVCKVCGLGRTIGNQRGSAHQDHTLKSERERTARRRYYSSIVPDLERVGPRGGSVLDVGCADGLLTRMMRERGFRAAGIDDYKDLNTDIRGVVRARFEEYSTDERFDLVMMIHAFEHFPDPRLALRRCRALLKPAGRLYLVVPNFGGSWSTVAKERWDWLNVEEHAFHYTREALQKLVEQNGFRVLDCVSRSPLGECPSLLTVHLVVSGAYERWPLRLWPFGGVIYRAAEALGPFVNWFVDRRGDGAEIRLTARLK